MGVLLPNYLEENVVNVPNFKISTSIGSSNVFQILQNLCLKQYQETSSSQPSVSQTSTTDMTCTMTQLTPLMTCSSAPANQNTGMATPINSMSESLTSSRTTVPTRTTPSTRQPTSVKHHNSSCNVPPTCCMHMHQPQSQVCKLGESLALRKVRRGRSLWVWPTNRAKLEEDHRPPGVLRSKQGQGKATSAATTWNHKRKRQRTGKRPIPSLTSTRVEAFCYTVEPGPWGWFYCRLRTWHHHHGRGRCQG